MTHYEAALREILRMEATPAHDWGEQAHINSSIYNAAGEEVAHLKQDNSTLSHMVETLNAKIEHLKAKAGIDPADLLKWVDETYYSTKNGWSIRESHKGGRLESHQSVVERYHEARSCINPIV